MSDYCIKVKRKGLNYYTDYMERYFESAAVKYGFHLTKRREQAEYACVTFDYESTDRGSKWITFITNSFSEMTYEQLEELSQTIGECFKSESVIAKLDAGVGTLQNIAPAALSMSELARNYGTPNVWYFSSGHSAFDEPIFVTENETTLKAESHSACCRPDEVFIMSVLNTGRASKGIAIEISFAASDDVDVKNLSLEVPNAKRNMPARCVFTDMVRMDTGDRTVFRAELSEFDIPQGFNKHSAKLSGRKKQDVKNSCGIRASFVPRGDAAVLRSMEIKIIPSEGSGIKLTDMEVVSCRRKRYQ